MLNTNKATTKLRGMSMEFIKFVARDNLKNKIHGSTAKDQLNISKGRLPVPAMVYWTRS